MTQVTFSLYIWYDYFFIIINNSILLLHLTIYKTIGILIKCIKRIKDTNEYLKNEMSVPFVYIHKTLSGFIVFYVSILLL